MAEIGLQRSGIVPLVGQRVAAGVAEHVRVCLEAELGLAARPLDHAGEASLNCLSALTLRAVISCSIGDYSLR